MAKIASDFNKPNRLTVITPEKVEGFVEQLDIKKFVGVGKATHKKMHALGIKTGSDLKQWSEINLVKAFGKLGRYYFKIARGIDHREVKPHRTRKSYGKERTFSEDIGDLDWVHNFLDDLKQIAVGMKTFQLQIKQLP